MRFRSLIHNYHDSNLASFTLGPRRELTLVIDLDPVWNSGSQISVSVQFGGIENFDEVSEFLGRIPIPTIPDAYLAEIIDLQYAGEGPNWVIIDLNRIGHIIVKSQNVLES